MRLLAPQLESRIFFLLFLLGLTKTEETLKNGATSMHTLHLQTNTLRGNHWEKGNHFNAGGDFSIYFSFWMTIFIWAGLCVHQIDSSICGHYLWPKGSSLDPANNWNSNKGILGLTETTEMTGRCQNTFNHARQRPRRKHENQTFLFIPLRVFMTKVDANQISRMIQWNRFYFKKCIFVLLT